VSTTLNRPDAYHPEVVKLLVRQSGPAQVPHNMLDLEDVIDLKTKHTGQGWGQGAGSNSLPVTICIYYSIGSCTAEVYLCGHTPVV
jgi:hypothetical protein